MKNLNLGMGWLALFFIAGFMVLHACDSGEKALDEITGNRAVQQYHKSKKDIETVTGRQSDKIKSIPDDEKGEEK